MLRKITAITLTLALALSIVGPVQAQTVTELQTEIARLQALMAGLQAQLGQPTAPTAPAVTVPVACTNVSFTRNLALRATGADVRCLQALLNTDPATRIAATGVGSLGQETQTFGPLTRTAVIAFQNKYASEVLTPVGLTVGTGFVGAQTRAKLNAMLTGAPTVPGVPTPPTPPTAPEAAVEGELSITRLAVPSAVRITKGQSSAVMGVELEAKDSRITLQRVDVTLQRRGSTEPRPWRTFDRVQIVIDGDVVATKNLTSSEDFTLVGNAYTTRVSGLNYAIPADGKENMEIVLRVRADAADALVTNVIWDVSLGTDSVRGIDAAGIHQLTGGTTTAPISRDFTTTLEAGRLEVRANLDTPAERIVQVSKTNATPRVEVLRFNLRNDSDVDVTVENLPVNILTATTANRQAENIVSVVRLMHGTTALGVENVPVTTTVALGLTDTEIVIFRDINLVVPAKSTVTLAVQVDAKGVTGNYDEGDRVSASVTTGINAIFGDEQTANVTLTATGNLQRLFSVAPSVSLVSTNIAITPDTASRVANATIVFDITAVGGDIYIGQDDAVAGRIIATLTGVDPAGTDVAAHLRYTYTSNATEVGTLDNFVIQDGTTRRVTVNATIDKQTAAALGVVLTPGFSGVSISAIPWGTTDEATLPNTILDALLRDLRTSQVDVRI